MALVKENLEAAVPGLSVTNIVTERDLLTT
jgi:hypothetical protein